MELTEMFSMLIQGFGMSLVVFGLTLLGSIPLGVIVALGRLSKFTLLRKLTQLYISIMRGTPLMLQMFAVFFMPFYVFGIQTGPGFKYVACIIGHPCRGVGHHHIIRTNLSTVSDSDSTESAT